MSAIKDLFLVCEDEWINDKIYTINGLDDMYQCGDITAEEYKELLGDVVRTDFIMDETEFQQLRSDFLKSVDILIGLI